MSIKEKILKPKKFISTGDLIILVIYYKTPENKVKVENLLKNLAITINTKIGEIICPFDGHDDPKIDEIIDTLIALRNKQQTEVTKT
jgi:hypothetical protein